MSNESENKKDLSPEVKEASADKVEEEANTSEDSQDVAAEAGSLKDGDKDSVDEGSKKVEEAADQSSAEEELNDKKETDPPAKEDQEDVKNNIDQKEDKPDSIDSKVDTTENGESDEEEEETSKKPEPPKKGRRGASATVKTSEHTETKKKTNKINTEDVELKEEKDETSNSKGTELGEIPRVDASISRFKNDDLKLLYRLLFKTPGKTGLIVKSIKKFNGFGFKKDTEEYTKKIESTKKFEVKQLKSICEMLDLEKKGTKDEIVERIIDFLIEPKDSGKQAGGGRPKRTAAVRANNRGYSSHDDSYSSDERRTSRGGRGKGRRSNLKDDTTSESDEEFHLSDSSETQSRSTKRKRGSAKHISDDELSEGDEPSTDESDGDRKKRKSRKVVNNKPKPKATPGRRGRKPATETEKKASATPKKPASRKRGHNEEESDEVQDDNASSSEDEPLIKKAKSPQPPTDEDIKTYVREILDGADLEEITMKTVCKQVYSHYPEFDLAHKKDFIKTTVKSLIST